MSEQRISSGRLVGYRLTKSDCAAILERREKSGGLFEGNPPAEDDVVPMLITRIFPGNTVCFNGQAQLDGNDTLWKTSVLEGTTPGTWHWPPRV